jgi:hypothetical protein
MTLPKYIHIHHNDGLLSHEVVGEHDGYYIAILPFETFTKMQIAKNDPTIFGVGEEKHPIPPSLSNKQILTNPNYSWVDVNDPIFAALPGFMKDQIIAAKAAESGE